MEKLPPMHFTGKGLLPSPLIAPTYPNLFLGNGRIEIDAQPSAYMQMIAP